MVLGKFRKAIAKCSQRGPEAPEDRYVQFCVQEIGSNADRAGECFAVVAERLRHPDPLRVLKGLSVLHKILRSDCPSFANEAYLGRRSLHVAVKTDHYAPGPSTVHEEAEFVRAYAEYLEEYVLFWKWSSMWTLPGLTAKEPPPTDPREEGAYALRQLRETPRLQRLFNKCIVFRLGPMLRDVPAAAYALRLIVEDARAINTALADLLQAFVEMYLGFEYEDARAAREFHDWYREKFHDLNELFREADAAGILQSRQFIVPWRLPPDVMTALEDKRASVDEGWTMVEPSSPGPGPPPFYAAPARSTGPLPVAQSAPARPASQELLVRSPAEVLLAPVQARAPAATPPPAAARASPASSVSSRYVGDSSRLFPSGGASPATVEHPPTPPPPPPPPPPAPAPEALRPAASVPPAPTAQPFAFPARARSSGGPPPAWEPTDPPLEAVYKFPSGPPPKPAGGSPAKAGGAPQEELPAYWDELCTKFLRPSCEYRLGKQLGKGAFGAVFEATLPGQSPPRSYAIKMQLCTPWEVVDNLWEGVVLSQIRHPNVVEVFDNFFLTTSELGFSYKTCLVMEKCDGTVRELISTVAAARPPKHLPEAEVRSLLVQLADMLAFIHSTRITAFDRHGNRVEGSVIHRDMKPENLFMVRRGGRIVLKQGDFGISRILTQKDVSTKIGSLMFMAPEVFRGAKYDSKADMFGLGAILYSLCALTEHNFTFWCGADDFDPHKFEPAVGDIKTERGAPAYSRPLSELIYALLDRVPEKRPSAAEILALDWLASDARACRLPRATDNAGTIVIQGNPIADAMLHDRLVKRLLKRSSSWNGKATPKVRVPKESDDESSSGAEEVSGDEKTPKAGLEDTTAWGTLTTLSEDVELEAALSGGGAPSERPEEGKGKGTPTPDRQPTSLRRTDRSFSFPHATSAVEDKGGPSPVPRPRSYSSHGPSSTTPTDRSERGSSHKKEGGAWRRRKKTSTAVVSYGLKALLLANVDSLVPTRRPRRAKAAGIQPSATITEGIHDRLTRPDGEEGAAPPRRSITFDNIAQLARGSVEVARRLPSATSVGSSYGDVISPPPASPATVPAQPLPTVSPASSSSSSRQSAPQQPPHLTWDSQGYSLAAPAPAPALSGFRPAGRTPPPDASSDDGLGGYEEKIFELAQRILEAFPDRFAEYEVIDALRSSGGDVNAAVVMLLSASSAHSYDPERKRKRKCARCGAQFTREANRGGACNHRGTWHSHWQECSSACKSVRLREKPKPGEYGVPHWSCCLALEMGAQCSKSPPHSEQARCAICSASYFVEVRRVGTRRGVRPHAAQENAAGQCKHAGKVVKALFGRLQWSCCHQSADKSFKGEGACSSSPLSLGPLLSALSHASSHSSSSCSSPLASAASDRHNVCPKSKPHVPLLPPPGPR